MNRYLTTLVCSLSVLGLVACGEDEARNPGPEVDAGVGDAARADAANADAAAPSGPLLPFKTGNTWTYKVTGDGETFMKVTTVGAEEPVGIGPHASKLAFKVVTKKGTADQTVSWQSVEGDRVVRYREQAFHASTGELEAEEWWNPAKLHVDSSAKHTASGAMWLEEYQETKQNVGEPEETETARDPWTVDGVNQSVTVPAGTFRAIVLTKAGGSSLKTYWYVPGIGKVKETGGQTEELVSYEVAP